MMSSPVTNIIPYHKEIKLIREKLIALRSKMEDELEDDAFESADNAHDALENAFHTFKDNRNYVDFKKEWEMIVNDNFSGPEWGFLSLNAAAADPGADFLARLETLKGKAEQLRDDGHTAAYDSAKKIYDLLTQAYETLNKDGDRKLFKYTGHTAIENYRGELDNHRGWSEFLVNLALAVTVVGLLIKGAINYANNRSFFFVHPTASAKLVDGIDNIIDAVPVP